MLSTILKTVGNLVIEATISSSLVLSRTVSAFGLIVKSIWFANACGLSWTSKGLS